MKAVILLYIAVPRASRDTQYYLLQGGLGLSSPQPEGISISETRHKEIKYVMFKAMILQSKAILDRRQPGLKFNCGVNHAQDAGFIARPVDL